MVKSEELIGTAVHLTPLTRCRIKRGCYNRVRPCKVLRASLLQYVLLKDNTVICHYSRKCPKPPPNVTYSVLSFSVSLKRLSKVNGTLNRTEWKPNEGPKYHQNVVL